VNELERMLALWWQITTLRLQYSLLAIIRFILRVSRA
jgi:hypothetical protein